MARFALDIDAVTRPARSQSLLDAVNHRVVIADGAMGTMLRDRELSLEADFHRGWQLRVPIRG
ncbi:UNVERIFIED_CONTAM: methionine synthase I (cobalamin-dependent) [Jeotgalibacillus campisalis]